MAPVFFGYTAKIVMNTRAENTSLLNTFYTRLTTIRQAIVDYGSDKSRKIHISLPVDAMTSARYRIQNHGQFHRGNRWSRPSPLP